ncbi:MAG: hypothetical protein GY740_16015 [Gammaproteobacteria bacterium]|nr:hypothetical protein [Gammaproteobacteria bacterium]
MTNVEANLTEGLKLDVLSPHPPSSSSSTIIIHHHLQLQQKQACDLYKFLGRILRNVLAMTEQQLDHTKEDAISFW